MAHVTEAAVQPKAPQDLTKAAMRAVRTLRLASSGGLAGVAVAGVLEAGGELIDVPIIAAPAISVELVAAAIGFIAVLLIILVLRHRGTADKA